MTFAVLYYLTDRPVDANWLEPQEREWLQGRLDREHAERLRILDLSWFRSMMDWRVIALGLVYMGCNIPQYGLSFFLPQIVKAFGVSNVTAGFITAVPYLVGAVGMICLGMALGPHRRAQMACGGRFPVYHRWPWPCFDGR